MRNHVDVSNLESASIQVIYAVSESNKEMCCVGLDCSNNMRYGPLGSKSTPSELDDTYT